MLADASTPTTLPCGTRAAISLVLLPFPQPISRMRSLPLRSSSVKTSWAIVCCSAEIRSYSDAFHSVIYSFLQQSLIHVPPIRSHTAIGDQRDLQLDHAL